MKRRHRLLIALAGLLLLAGLAAHMALRPENVARLLLRQAGAALGLEIVAGGATEYRLFGTPRLVLHDVSAREPGATAPVLRAERIAIAVPWATIRSRGATLDVQRIALDAPVLDLRALQAWQAKRPPSELRVPTVGGGMSVTRGRMRGDGWELADIGIELPRLQPGAPVAAHVAGRFLDLPMRMRFNLHLAATRPANHAGAAAVGDIEIAGDGWRLPARIKLSAPLHLDADGLRLAPARLAASASYVSGGARLPFALGVYGPVHLDEGRWTLTPAGLALRGEGLLPRFDAHGSVALGQRLLLRLEGVMPDWNEAWPALPPPLGQSGAPLPFRLDYAGAADAGGMVRLRLRRDGTRFDGRFRLPELLAWRDAAQAGSPLPPLDGRVIAPRLEVSGARLEGVEVEIDDPRLAEAP